MLYNYTVSCKPKQWSKVPSVSSSNEIHIVYDIRSPGVATLRVNVFLAESLWMDQSWVKPRCIPPLPFPGLLTRHLSITSKVRSIPMVSLLTANNSTFHPKTTCTTHPWRTHKYVDRTQIVYCSCKSWSESAFLPFILHRPAPHLRQLIFGVQEVPWKLQEAARDNSF